MVSLRGAHVKGNLCFSTTTISNPGGTAVKADQLIVGSDLFCDDGFTAEGLMDLTDVHVTGEFNLSSAKLRNAGDVALFAPRLVVDKDMLCRDEFTADGTVCLIGAHIGGKLSFTNAQLIGAALTADQLEKVGIKKILAPVNEDKKKGGNSLDQGHLAWAWTNTLHGIRWLIRDRDPKAESTPRSDEIVTGLSGLALIADGLRVETDMACDAGFAARGEVRLKGARIRRNLDFSDATVENRPFNLKDATVENRSPANSKDKRLPGKKPKSKGSKNKGTEDKEFGTALNAEDLQAERMLMPARCKAGRINLRYGKMIELDDKRGVQSDQINILGLSYERLIPPLDPETRLKWLARSYLQLGHDDKARKVQLEAERRRRKEIKAPIRKPWGWIQDVTIGYGYRSGRAALLFILVLLAGTLGFAIWPPPPMDSKNAPYFDSFFYTLDVLVPFADFGQRDAWNSSLGHEVFKVVLAIWGWTVAVTAIAGINRALKRP
jgi:hypothetical protein